LGEELIGVGARSGFGLHCAQAGASGFGGSGSAGGGGAGGPVILGCVLAFLSGRLWTTRQPGLACGGASSIAGGISRGGASMAGGLHSGWNSPLALNLDLTAMSSAISYCSCRRSSLSFPISANRIRTSAAMPLVKSIVTLPLRLLDS